ncbi:uncharacterized protein Z518_06348 [Rhinocladiella mackenziei CBS 650.93]|uniref:Dicer-like protein 2 n=1 Tax=Rhinocladiella mackenziei CBS 650.93 TaxID=1442369 RepID=A0A0D2IQM7_9EURO|nr:uncharacterized protein Z518_06348 [Rhinocladiella mackenziei CBS 650.93]KIX05476.1 hypothetical protein Z518_06348 [Rhinocladiella mackenziei CBS 650.93]
MDFDLDDTWSDTSLEEDNQDNPIQSRAYQIEMFEHSLKGNIIAVMATGSGKTQVAKLRIEAELERSLDKQVWFTAPSVVLALQQHSFLSKQLPAFQFRLITGMDNAEHWKTKDVWDKALCNINVVVSTPRILLDALNYGFLSLQNISLLVIDEAHHCVDNSDLNNIMRLHYHPYNAPEYTGTLPHILGLSASPVTKKRVAELRVLETNLNAKCMTPTQQLEEYTAFLNMPRLETLTFAENLNPPPKLLIALRERISGIQIDDDPLMKKLRGRDNLQSQEKLEKILRKNYTPALKELRSFSASSATMHASLGNWACDIFITACIRKVQAAAFRGLDDEAAGDTAADKLQFIKSVLQPLEAFTHLDHPEISSADSLSPKVKRLLEYLIREHRPNLRALIFVQARHTAWSLTELIQAHPVMQNYQAFSFVGVSNPSHQGVFDFAELRVQNENLEKFRRGELNLCVATSVLEEGIDVPAINLVVCFDERPNLRSFVQSRGRARHQDSKYVLFRSTTESWTKVKKWQALENEMKTECEEAKQALEARELLENLNEFGGDVYRIESTGAVLCFNNSRELLQRFCAKLPKTEESERIELAFCIDGEIGVNVSARVYLPSSLPPQLQIAQSKLAWRTEKMAKRDAAFQAYLALYHAGLVTENLLPPEWPKEEKKATKSTGGDRDSDGRESICAVQQQHDPWPNIMEKWAKPDTLYAHRLQIDDEAAIYPRMLVLLPQRLFRLDFPLYTTSSKPLKASVGPGAEVHDFPVDLAREVSLHLLTTVLGRRLCGLQKDQLPFLLVPDVQAQSLQAWYETASTITPLADLLSTGGLGDRDYLVRLAKKPIPYVYRHSSLAANIKGVDNSESPQIQARKLPRKLEYLSWQEPSMPTKQASLTSLSVSECSVLGLPPEYGHLVLLVPSITHMLEVALRSMEACEGPLSDLAYENVELVSEALTLPRVSARNYQRLEFLGDDLLKFYSTIQVFVDYPNHPENQLSIYRERIVNNVRLQRSTRSLGLDRFLTQRRFSGAEWTAGVAKPGSGAGGSSSKTHLSSKILADVIEALLGAAYLDGKDKEDSEPKLISALKLLIGEVQWRRINENLETFTNVNNSLMHDLHLFTPVESMIGYSFQNRALLSEALTKSCLGGALSSYDRLELLGDAVLDHIVKTRLYNSPLLFDPEQMTIRRHALVSHATLAFFALQTSHSHRTFEIRTDPRSHVTVDHESTRTIYLPDHIRRIGDRAITKQREATLAAYHEIRAVIIDNFQKGRKFPWSELLRIKAPKSYSDVVESILGAVFVDSGGDLEPCTRVLETMGFMNLVHRFATERDLQVHHPEAMLQEAQVGCQLVTTRAKAGWRCKVMLDGERIAHAKKASCKDEASCRAAERAVEVLSRRRKKEHTPEAGCVDREPGFEHEERDVDGDGNALESEEI